MAARLAQRMLSAGICLALCVVGAVSDVSAQDPAAGPGAEGRTLVFGSAGDNTQWDDESRLGQAIAVSGGVGYRVTRHLCIEGLVNRLEHQRDVTFHAITYDSAGNPIATPYTASLTGAATYVLGQARYVFSLSRVQPYVAGAFGVMHYSGNGWGAVLPPGPGQPAAAGSVRVTTPAMGGTGGVDFAVTRRVTLGPYFGLLMSNTDEAGTKTAAHAGVRLGVAW